MTLTSEDNTKEELDNIQCPIWQESALLIR